MNESHLLVALGFGCWVLLRLFLHSGRKRESVLFVFAETATKIKRGGGVGFRGRRCPGALEAFECALVRLGGAFGVAGLFANSAATAGGRW